MPFDNPAYLSRVRARCFICALRDGVEGFEHRVLLNTPEGIAFLSKFPWVVGHVLVVSREHREDVVGDFTDEEYLALQRLVRRVAIGVQSVVPSDRLYVMSLGSQQANTHVHWHVVPCPPGLPYEQQQFELLTGGYLDIPDAESERLAAALRFALAADPSR